MPTFNQLVRKGRAQSTDKSNSPALQKGFSGSSEGSQHPEEL